MINHRSHLKPINGTRSLRLDGRTREAKRRGELIDKFTNALGGPDRLNVGEAELVERLATLTVRAETMERLMLTGGAGYSDDTYLRLCGAIRRLTEDLDLDRPARRAPNADHDTQPLRKADPNDPTADMSLDEYIAFVERRERAKKLREARARAKKFAKPAKKLRHKKSARGETEKTERM